MRVDLNTINVRPSPENLMARKLAEIFDLSQMRGEEVLGESRVW